MQKFWNSHGFRLFAGVWLAYSACPPFLSYDSYWTVATALQLMRHGTTQLDSLVASAPVQAEYGLECVPEGRPAVARSMRAGCEDGHWYSNFPLGTAVIVTPVFAAMKVLAPFAGLLVPRSGFFARTEVAAFFQADLMRGRALAELFCAALIGAFTVWLQYRIGLVFLGARGALWFALLFAFGTTEFSLASRNLYPHGATLLLLSAVLLLLVRAHSREASWRDYAFAGLLLAAAFTVRPSNAISCGVLAVYVAIHERRRLLPFLAGAAPVSALFFCYQFWTRHSWLPLYITAPRNSNPFWEGMTMNFVSPSRGLLIFTPVFLVSAAGMYLAWRSDFCGVLPRYLAAIVALHTLLIAAVWPGHCYGPRYFADVTHLMMFFLLPAILWWRDGGRLGREAHAGAGQTGSDTDSTGHTKRWPVAQPENSSRTQRRLVPRPAIAAVFLALAGWGVFVHVHGATSIAANQWSALPVNVDDARWRVWDWSDPQFLRGLR